MSNLVLWILIYAAGVISGAVFPPLTKWGIKQWRQIKAKRDQYGSGIGVRKDVE